MSDGRDAGAALVLQRVVGGAAIEREARGLRGERRGGTGRVR